MNPTPTPYDLRWSMFGIPVRVHPTFWLLAAFLGWPVMKDGIGYFLLFGACVFVSILVHELGHVFMGRIFGEPGAILLYGFGGLALGNYQTPRRWERILVLLAGPGAGFALYGVVYLLKSQLNFAALPPDTARIVIFTVVVLLWINLFWGILNLMPVFPMDGGQITREICLAVTPRRGLSFSLGLSFLCAGLIAVYSGLVMARPHLWYPDLDPQFNAMMFAILAVQSFVLLQQAHAQQRHWNVDDHWQ